MTLQVGEVISVHGTKIGIRVFEESNKETIFFKGQIYKGISIREYIHIQRGFIDIVCLVEGEFLDEQRLNITEPFSHIRKIEVKPIGYFQSEKFTEGIKYMPMIKDAVYLMEESRIQKIFSKGGEEFIVGSMLKEEIPVSLPWEKLFNSHIGVFGNTGSGKSNTLAKLYTELFVRKSEKFKGKSRFIIFDFNGEYTANQISSKEIKRVFNLKTGKKQGDRFSLYESEFWSLDTLSILFQATPATQRPFLNRVIDGRNKYPNSLKNFLSSTFERVFKTSSPKPELLELLKHIARVINDENLNERLNNIAWHGKSAKFFEADPLVYYNGEKDEYSSHISEYVNNIKISRLNPFTQLIVRANLQLCRELIQGHVQFEHIQPLLKRIESSLTNLNKVIKVIEDDETNLADESLLVISLRDCNTDTKKILPLLLAKQLYQRHRQLVSSPPDRTLHIIIDEAHNILSDQHSRESESWKDYRLELFEEIIKEGRKFGIFITISSQRPADISATIVSQIHNFFIHRLVNERDLFLLDNTITTLDSLSRGLIPSLARGCCVVTGTAFELPMILQIEQLALELKPDSEDVSLKKLWE